MAVFRYLVKAGPGGATVGEIQQVLDIPLSTLSHHLSRMAHIGLIDQTRHGRAIRCLPNYSHLAELLAFLQRECCAGHGEIVAASMLSAECERD